MTGDGEMGSLSGGTLDFFQATAFADFCIPLGRLLGTNFEHPSAK